MGACGNGACYCRVGDTGDVDCDGAALVMADETHTGGGAAVKGNVNAAQDVIMRDRLHNQGGGSVTFQSQDNAILWQAIIDLGNSISSVREKLDDLPNRVARLEVQVQPVPVPIPVIHPLVWAIITIAAFGAGAYLFGGI